MLVTVMLASSLAYSFACPSLALGRRGGDKAHLSAAMLVAELEARAKRFIAARSSRALLWQYSSDYTPLCRRVRVKKTVFESHVRRSAKAAAEIVIERSFVSDASGRAMVILNAPAEREDKGAMCHWEPGHTAVSAAHHVYDQALLTPFTRLPYQTLGIVPMGQGDDRESHLEGLATWLSSWGATTMAFMVAFVGRTRTLPHGRPSCAAPSSRSSPC